MTVDSLAELIQGYRSLRRNPVLSCFATLILALGIGGAVTVFSLLNAIVLRPLPYAESDRLVAIRHALSGIRLPDAPLTPGMYLFYRKSATQLQEIGAYQDAEVNLGELGGQGGLTEHATATRVSASLFRILRVSPRIGRGISDEEDKPNGSRVAILSDGLWRRRYGADPTIIGRMIRIDGSSYEMIGVMPASFRFPTVKTEIWLPLALDPLSSYTGGFSLLGVARLRRSTTIDAAQAELQRLLPELAGAFPSVYPGIATTKFLRDSRARVFLRPLREQLVGSFSRFLWIIVAAASLVLLVACANVANLLLVRAEARRGEIGVRIALGAGRARVMRLCFGEALLLAVAGSCLGLIVAEASIGLFRKVTAIDIPRLAEVTLDGSAVALAVGLVLAVATLCSLIPALQLMSVEPDTALREAGRSRTTIQVSRRAQGGLVAAQVSLAFVLLSSSAVLARTIWHLHLVRPGFDPEHVLTLSLSFPAAQYPRLLDVGNRIRTIIDRVQGLSGVSASGVVSKLPLRGASSLAPISVETAEPLVATPAPTFAIRRASADYFRAMGISLLAGRLYGKTYAPQSEPEVVVTRAFAEYYWHDSIGTQALQKRIRLTTTKTWSTIVGVVESVRDTSLGGAPVGAVYFPIAVPSNPVADSEAPYVPREVSLVVRTKAEPLAAIGTIDVAIHESEPALPIFNVQPMTAVVARSTSETSFVLYVLVTAALITIALGAVGLYGTLAYFVSLQTREIGVRIALGARRRDVIGLVVYRGLNLALWGVVMGIGVFLLVARVFHSLIFGLIAADPLSIAVVGLLLGVVAVAASGIPAVRAANIDPMLAIREG